MLFPFCPMMHAPLGVGLNTRPLLRDGTGAIATTGNKYSNTGGCETTMKAKSSDTERMQGLDQVVAINTVGKLHS